MLLFILLGVLLFLLVLVYVFKAPTSYFPGPPQVSFTKNYVLFSFKEKKSKAISAGFGFSLFIVVMTQGFTQDC
jgi:hypothetical protein